ncbi:MAG TPA: DUF2190 family protein [candidate division Zixibacteria bacterium]|nr:DUF2190 family protein [candidate division Zixibacteria bacterium]
MAKKFDLRSKDYDTANYTLLAAVSAGDFATLVSIYGFYLVDGAIGDVMAVVTKASLVYAAKLAGTAWAVGDPLYWDAAVGSVTPVAAALPVIGYATRAAAAADTYGYMNFDGLAAFVKI